MGTHGFLKKRDRQSYKLAIQYLLSMDGVSSQMLSRHLTKPSIAQPKDMKDVFCRLCRSLQNRGMMPNVIGGAVGGTDHLGNVLFAFDPQRVAKKYQAGDEDRLVEQIFERFQIPAKSNRKKNGLWWAYCHGVICGAHFLAQFEDVREFRKWVRRFVDDKRLRAALPLMLRLEIDGLGFALSCDFLKEIGYTQYGKPDVHLKEIFKALDLCPAAAKGIKEDYEVLKAIIRIAENVKTTPYAVDKVFWLIGSGNFYYDDVHIGRHKEKFIQYAKRQLESSRHTP